MSRMKIIKDALASQYLWYKIGGRARLLVQCLNETDVLDCFEMLKKEKISNFFVVGLGSNLLFTDEEYDGAIIQMGQDPRGVSLLGRDVVESFAGNTLDSVIQFGFENNLVGLEWAGGLPGTVGAAIRGNVGAFGGEIKDIFFGAEIFDTSSKKPEVKSLNRRDIKFSYRSSTVKKNPNLIVLSARFKLEQADDAKVARARQTYLANIEYRKNKHPLNYPSTGSAFKNINNSSEVKKVLDVFPDIEQDVRIKWHGKVSVGYLIKRLDLSGLRIGNAQISNKHSNFIVNLGDASFEDVVSIIKTVQDAFEKNFGFVPEPEVEIVQ